MIFVANPVVSCFESTISMLLLGALQIQPWGAHRVWKEALKKKRLHKNKWFLNIFQTGINPTTPDLTGSTGFVTKNHKYFSPLTSRICKCFIWQNSVFFRHPVPIHFKLQFYVESCCVPFLLLKSCYKSKCHLLESQVMIIYHLCSLLASSITEEYKRSKILAYISVRSIGAIK